jgi:hypothetical protein
MAFRLQTAWRNELLWSALTSGAPGTAMLTYCRLWFFLQSATTGRRQHGGKRVTRQLDSPASRVERDTVVIGCHLVLV